MTSRALPATGALALILSILIPTVAEGQLGGLVRRATKAAEDELAREIEETVRNGVRCIVGDSECVRRARSQGRTPVMTDREGNILKDAEGRPITDPANVPPTTAAAAGAPAATATPAAATPAAAPPVAAAGPTAPASTGPAERPGTGAWANYDFVPGDRMLFFDDFSTDRIGDFPRRFELVAGNWEVVEWQGGRYLRATSRGTVGITLPETLPERFTIEFPASVQHGNAYLRVTTQQAYDGTREYVGSVPTLEFSRAGLRAIKGQGPEILTPRRPGSDRAALVTVRIMADGAHLKMYLDDHRVANAPTVVLPRTNKLFLAVSSADARTPIMIGPVRVAAGGLALYDALSKNGRVATQGILFATNSDVIRPESTPTLSEIGTMLKTYADLRIAIEGHTDSDGDDASNLDLSRRRAAAVKTFLVGTYGVDGGRLVTEGLGETRPVADNATAQGKQQNRRVELVRQAK